MTERAFHKPDRFYDRLQNGQTLHYDNGSDHYVRCIVEEGVDKNGQPGKVLVPVALVGDWGKLDLPYRLPNGKIHLGPAAEAIANRKGWQPNDLCIYETNSNRGVNPGYFPPYGEQRKDPRTMTPIDLTVPLMTPDEKRVADAISTIEMIHEVKYGEVAEAAIASALDQIIALATQARAQLK